MHCRWCSRPVERDDQRCVADGHVMCEPVSAAELSRLAVDADQELSRLRAESLRLRTRQREAVASCMALCLSMELVDGALARADVAEARRVLRAAIDEHREVIKSGTRV